jgi:hypothetical protein
MKTQRLDTFAFQKDNVIWAETAEGYLKFDNLIATTTGEFPYKKDGKIVYEKRTPEEVFKQEHIDSFVGKSITLLPNLNHPKEFLKPENDAQYGVGTIVSAERKDEDKLAIAGVIKNPEAIKKIKSNIISSKDKRVDALEGSCGYSLELGSDLVQRNLYCNHFSIVAKGRAGAITKLNRDYDDTEESFQNPTNPDFKENQKTDDNNSNNNFSKDMSDQKPTELEKQNQELQKKLDEATANLKAEQEKAKDIQTKLDATTKAQEDGKKENQANVDALTARIDAMENINKKKELLEKAQANGIKLDVALKDVNLDTISPRDLSIKLINAANPEIKLDSASDDIIAGIFLGMQPVTARNDSLYSSFGNIIQKNAEIQQNFDEATRDGVNAGFAEFEKLKNTK